jgi:glutathione S-transferase
MPKKAPLGALPVMELPEGVFVQSTALARWAAKKSDLYPKDGDDLSQLIVDEIMESANEMGGKAGFDKDEAIKKAKRAEFVEKVLPQYMTYFQTRLDRSGGPFFLGSKLTIADLATFSSLHGIYVGQWDYVPADTIEKSYPGIHAWYLKVKEHPVAKAELEAKI